MSLFNSLYAYFRPEPPKAPTVKQAGIQARAIRHVISYGQIDSRTILSMGTNDATKLITRLRRLGILYEANDLNGHYWRDNASGHGRHKVHRWTGNLPASWERPARERRFLKRGGR